MNPNSKTTRLLRLLNHPCISGWDTRPYPADRGGTGLILRFYPTNVNISPMRAYEEIKDYRRVTKIIYRLLGCKDMDRWPDVLDTNAQELLLNLQQLKQ